MRVKKKVTDTVERKVAALLLQDPEYSAKYLKREVEKTLKKEGKTNFTARTYSTIKRGYCPIYHRMIHWIKHVQLVPVISIKYPMK